MFCHHPHGLSVLVETEQLSKASLGPMAAIESATRLASEALGVDEDLGTGTPGKLGIWYCWGPILSRTFGTCVRRSSS